MTIRAVAILVMSVLFSSPSFACMSPDFEDHHFPSCTIPLPNADERVSVVYAGGPTELSDYHLGQPNQRTRFVTVHVNDNDARNYLVLSAREQTIWNFTGDVKSVSRVIVLGAGRIGPSGAGVIGIPKTRISFTDPDLTALESVFRTSCTRIGMACIPRQWFGDALNERTSLHPKPTQPRQRVDEITSWQSTEIARLRRSDPGNFSIIRPKAPDTIVVISPETVVSVKPSQQYELLPGQPGLNALVATGALTSATSIENKAKIQAYAETLSARYRTRFDPDFLLVPTIDYVVTKDVTLPPQLRPTSLFVPKGVPAPDMNGNRGYAVCIYFEDQAQQPISGSGLNSKLCRLNSTSRAVPDEEQDILRAATGFDRLDFGSQDCQMAAFKPNTHIAAIALSEGSRKRYRDDPVRQIDVEVRREGPTVLYLSMEGGPIRWNVKGSQVVAIYSRTGPALELTNVVLNGRPYTHSRLRSPDKDCPQFAPLWPNRLGPAIAHLDKMFRLLAGQGIDELITFTETGTAWREANSKIPLYVIE